MATGGRQKARRSRDKSGRYPRPRRSANRGDPMRSQPSGVGRAAPVHPKATSHHGHHGHHGTLGHHADQGHHKTLAPTVPLVTEITMITSLSALPLVHRGRDGPRTAAHAHDRGHLPEGGRGQDTRSRPLRGAAQWAHGCFDGEYRGAGLIPTGSGARCTRRSRGRGGARAASRTSCSFWGGTPPPLLSAVASKRFWTVRM